MERNWRPERLVARESLARFVRFLSRFQPDGFVIALIGTVAVAALLPCQGTSAKVFHALGVLAVGSLFFLQGARLSRAERNRSILSVTDRGSILLIVYAAFSASVVKGLWHLIPLVSLARLALIDAILLGAALLMMIGGSRALRFERVDESAIVFCGSQKSLVSGIPMASALITGPALGLFVLPIMMYHSMQLLVCAWLAKMYSHHSHSEPASTTAIRRLPILNWRRHRSTG
jgi:predicted Na+-dependent transporter